MWVGSNRFAGQNGLFLNGLIGLRVELSRKLGQVDPYFLNDFIFFALGNRCNLSIVYEFLNCD